MKKEATLKDHSLMISQEIILLLWMKAIMQAGNQTQVNYFRGLVSKAKGVTYLSATFAKTPKNMPIYALKTAISEANLSEDDLIVAIEKGGVALQEILATDLVEAGQMLRRERTFEGIEVDYRALTNLKTEHQKIADSMTEIIRDIIHFQENYIKGIVKDMDTEAAIEGARVDIETGTNKAGVDNVAFVSKVFNVIDQLVFTIKASSAADEAIELLKKEKKPVIAVKNTMESYLQYLGVVPGEIIQNTDFSSVLERGLKGVMKISKRDAMGETSSSEISVNQLTENGRIEYKRILDKINKTSSGISISPIDQMIYKLNKEGYKVGEITGRKIFLRFRDDGSAIVVKRDEKDKKKILREFNNWENPGKPRGIDGFKDMALIINSSGSTGISGHSSQFFKDQRQRHMLTVQIELNINTEIQKRGRINRTGQVTKPAYTTITTAIPAEQRLMMMAKKKLKSLDANVSSDQSQAGSTFEANDFLNKYGDQIVIEYLKENREMNDLLLDPFKMNAMKEEELAKFTYKENAATKASGRVAILPTALQTEFYDEIGKRYDDHIKYLDSVEENDLVVKILPLDAVTIGSRILVAGKGGFSPFGKDSILETVEVNVLKKPHKFEKIQEIIDEGLEGVGRKERKTQLKNNFNSFWKTWTKDHLDRKVDAFVNRFTSTKEAVLDVINNGEPLITEKSEIAAKVSGDLIREEYSELETKFYRQHDFIESDIFDRYEIGRVYRVPYVRDSTAPIYSNGIFLGWHVDLKRKNPFAPSAIQMKFATQDSRQMVQIPTSQRDWLNDLSNESYKLEGWMQKDILDDWDNSLPDNRRETKSIVTGNILQAVGDVKGGRLISYSTKDGGLKRGIMLTDNKSLSSNEIRVPISRARKFIKTISPGDFIESSNGEIILTNQGEGYWTIEVAASKAKGGKYYLDKTLRNLLLRERFDKFGNKMRGEFPKRNLDGINKYFTKRFWYIR